MSARTAPRSGRVWRSTLGGLAAVAALGVLFAFVLKPETARRQKNNNDTAIDPIELDARRRCEDELQRILDGLLPGRLGITSDRLVLINELNNWDAECGLQPTAPHPAQDGELLQSLLSGDLLARTLSERFRPEDAYHFRACMLARDIVTQVTDRKPSNVARYVALFDYVSRYVSLIPREYRDTLPLTPYESLLLGMGIEEDRAWVYALLLQQMRTDVVILAPRKAELKDHWLIGVLSPRDGVLLFDPHMGLPIPADEAEQTAFPRQPATLAEVLVNDEPFRRLDVADAPYPLSSEDMQDVEVRLIGTSSAWAPRMAELQHLLPQGFNVELYDGLGENRLREPGLLERVANLGKDLWSKDDIQVWEFPNEQLVALEAARENEDAQNQLAAYTFWFNGPYVPRLNSSGEASLVPIEKSLHLVRVEQLQGKFSDALKDFLPIRSAARQVNIQANQAAAGYAAVWSGVSQYETGKETVALNTFEQFLSAGSGSPLLLRSAAEWSSLCLLADDKYAQAIDALKSAPPGLSPSRDAWLIRRWSVLANPQSQPKESTPAAPVKAAERQR